MKKLISILIVAVMAFSAVASAIPAGALYGLTIAEIDVPYFDVKPTFDGIVSEAEWGDPSVVVDQSEVGGSMVVLPEDMPEANALNTFFYRNPAGGYDIDYLNMRYTMWFRWDENYYYIAVKVADPDGHSLKNGKWSTWNGDAFQTRIDPEGPNASCVLGPDEYDAEYDGKPWSRGDIDNMFFGYVEAAGGFSEAWENETNKGMTEFSGGDCIVSITPAYGITENELDYTPDTASGITTYEIAIPWHYIDSYNHEYSNYSKKNNKDGAIGREYGMSTVVYNADGFTGASNFNAGLAWGSGIINAQQNYYPQTCGGSNRITLSGEKVSEGGSYNSGYVRNERGFIPYIPPHDYDTEINERVYVKLTYDRSSDMNTYGTAISGERVQEPDGNWVVRWDRDPRSQSGLNDRNYLSTESRYRSRGCCYTMEFDVKVTDLQTFEAGYPCTLYNWFGGSSTVDYECGYDFDLGKFVIRESNSERILAEKQADFSLDEWHHWVFQYNKDTCEIRFYFDPEMKDGKVSPDAEPVFAMTYRYFDCSGKDECELIFRRFNAQIMMDNVEFYNFVDFRSAPVPERGLAGDANCDDNVDLKDVLLMRRVVAGAEDLEGQGYLNADIIVDDNIDIKDILQVHRVCAGIVDAEFIYDLGAND